MDSTLLSGVRLGRYEIRSKLGQGGMGEVYLAEDRQLGRSVAIKFLTPELIADERANKRLMKEARAVASLDHPHICSVYEVGEADGRSFIAMQYLEGESLDARIKRKPLDLKESLAIASQITDALAEAHSHGIVHRDIKPGNIMITTRGQAKVMDFGLAKVIQQAQVVRSEAETEALLSTPGAILGTVPYMSPEQVRGEVLDGRSDIFSLGVVLYEMLSGRHPFGSESVAETISAILTREPLTSARYLADIPAGFERILRKCLEKDQDRRYQSARDLLIDLRNLQRDVGEEIGGRAVRRVHRRSKAIDSLAVLPLANASTDPNMEYLSDGITESIINNLSQLPKLRVMARTTVFRYKGKEVDPQEVGRVLGVRAVLTGRVLQLGERLIIGAELVDVADGSQFWGEQYNRRVSDIFAVHEEISREITEKLRLKLSGKEKRRLSKRYTVNTEAYKLYLKGRYYWNQRTEDDVRKGIECFRKAIKLDPNYALAYTGLADCYTFLGDAGILAIPPKEAFSKALAAAERALQIDDMLAEAHASLAHLRIHHFEWLEAEIELKRAIKLNPNYATAYQWYGFYFAANERHGEAMAAIARAQELDPISLAISTDVGVLYYYARQYDRAIAQYQKTLEMDPSFARAYVTLGSAYGQKGMHEEAISMFQKAIALSRNTARLAGLGRAYAAAGRKDEALLIVDELNELSKQRYTSAYSVALIYAWLGEIDRSFDCLEAAYAERAGDLIFLKVDPWLSPLRSDHRFTDLLRRVGLPE